MRMNLWFKALVLISTCMVSAQVFAAASTSMATDANDNEQSKNEVQKNRKVILRFSDGEMITTFGSVCRLDGKECFFTPFAAGRFEPNALREDVDFGKVPVIFMPNWRLELFKPCGRRFASTGRLIGAARMSASALL